MRKDRSACSVYFEHPLAGNDFNEDIYRYITLYELHLRYLLQALRYAGFPEAFHTVGSATAVKALPYVRAGGMNRRQAGEDFYFIQKLIPAGGYFSLDSTVVYPSPRASYRVPFGTGAAIGRLTGEEADDLMTYDLNAYLDLSVLFRMTEVLFTCSPGETTGLYGTLPPGLRSCLTPDEFTVRTEEIKRNTSGYASFRKRFFIWFNMFRIIKYLNQVHQAYYSRCSVIRASSELLNMVGISGAGSPRELLDRYRSLERAC
jgi:hypothetical protein